MVACLLLTEPNGTVRRRVSTFGTMTADLLALADWLGSSGVTHIAMESTGVYWRPVYNILEGDCAVILVNAQHIKAVPGRKTDVKDSEWLAGRPPGSILRHGLLQPSFIPPAPIRELRDLTRYRKTLIGERAQEANRLQKVLETANIKLAMVATDVLGVSGRQMLAALLGGEQDAEALAELARGRLREKLPQLRRALVGRVQPYHRILIERILAHIDFLEESIATLQQEIDRCLLPFAQAVALLVTIPGVSAHAAATLIAEIGTEMAQFPSAKHLASWAGVCPGNRESGGKRRSGKPTAGNRWVKAVLGEVAWSVSRTRDNYLVAQYQRMARRKGRLKAIGATMHTVLVIAYHVLRDGTPYRELGADYFDKLDTARLERHHVNRLKALGYYVVLTPLAAA